MILVKQEFSLNAVPLSLVCHRRWQTFALWFYENFQKGTKLCNPLARPHNNYDMHIYTQKESCV